MQRSIVDDDIDDNYDGDCYAVQNVDEDVDDEKNRTVKTLEDTQH